jgi:hypothetical protein
MNLDERITLVEKQLQELSQPALDIPNTEVIKQLVVCEKHGDYEQRQRVSTGLVRLPGAPTSCPGCLKDELVFLRNEKAKRDDRTRTANVERLMLELKVPARFEACTLDNYQPVSEEAARALKSAERMPAAGQIAERTAAAWLCAENPVREKPPGLCNCEKRYRRAPELGRVHHGAENRPGV